MSLPDSIAVVSGIAGMIFGVFGMIFGVYGYMITKANMVKDFFIADDSEEMRMARKSIYNYSYYSDKYLNENLYFGKICNHYHFYGLLVKKHYLPKWILEGANGSAIVKCYEKSKNYIMLRRRKDIYYAEYFEWLYKWIIKHRRG